MTSPTDVKLATGVSEVDERILLQEIHRKKILRLFQFLVRICTINKSGNSKTDHSILMVQDNYLFDCY